MSTPTPAPTPSNPATDFLLPFDEPRRAGLTCAWRADVRDGNFRHPNEKPIELPTLFITLHTAPNQLVIDPFMGSGTTLRAAKDLGRRAIGIEIDEQYCEIAARRMGQEILNLQ